MSTGPAEPQRRVTTRELLDMKRRGQRIVVLTAYDVLFARLVDEAGVDVVLVGDSLGQVVLGYDSTLPVTLDEMIHHARAVRRGVKRALLVVDLPFLSFQVNPEETVRNAGRVLKESGAEAVKLEGGDEEAARHVRALVRAGIPVMGHLGLTPQSVHALGGYRVQGRGEEAAVRLREDARRLQDAGSFAIVLELVPTALGGAVSRDLEIPTIGIGAGPDTDGQVLVLPDMLGLNEGFRPKFLRRFAELAVATRAAVAEYASAVRAGEFPDAEHSFE
ncbi:MAG TPA: 3-methyl-2-oxobutanoate hydroxymethyltransferase [Longimicrobiales bacterium]|nr:3-methyl-2-oxobutanoate hydroxymethyltransferase [Longimicrobiales bacterium]